jgi:hypothetical protein
MTYRRHELPFNSKDGAKLLPPFQKRGMVERPVTRPNQGDERALHRRPPLWATTPTHPHTRYSTSRIGPRLQSIHARHSSNNKRRVTCAVVATRLKTLAFLLSQSVRMTSMTKELVIYLSAFVKRPITKGHHSPFSAWPECTMGGS